MQGEDEVYEHELSLESVIEYTAKSVKITSEQSAIRSWSVLHALDYTILNGPSHIIHMLSDEGVHEANERAALEILDAADEGSILDHMKMHEEEITHNYRIFRTSVLMLGIAAVLGIMFVILWRYVRKIRQNRKRRLLDEALVEREALRLAQSTATLKESSR